ncbi:hypothetical protein C2G38_2248896 [Gigaspora rosea]|uniref:Uncharacterized protein n=1 Tax=Gigaspora rosea TaxID=44941 RepID=A0A397UTA2_9GLOM|nr:hypothetical protein C2G38_2248896 [Gigaspora rosea]
MIYSLNLLNLREFMKIEFNTSSIMKLNDLTKLYQKNVDKYLKDTKEYIMLNGDTENKVEEQQKIFKEKVESFIKDFGKEAADYIDKSMKEYMETHGGKSPSKQWEKKQRFSFVEERIAVYIETFKENFFKKFQYEPQKHHLMKYPKYGVKYLFYESWKEYHIKLSNKSTKNGIEQDDNEVINRYGYHEENPLTRQLNPFKQAQKIGNEKYKQRQSRQECSKNLVNPFRQAQQSGQDKFKQQTKQDDVNSVTKGTLTTLTLPLRQQELIPPPKPINNYIDDGESWQEKIKRTGYDPRKDPILKPFIEKLVEEGIEIPGMRGMEIIDDFL